MSSQIIHNNLVLFCILTPKYNFSIWLLHICSFDLIMISFGDRGFKWTILSPGGSQISFVEIVSLLRLNVSKLLWLVYYYICSKIFHLFIYIIMIIILYVKSIN